MRKKDNYMGGSAIQISRFLLLLMYIFTTISPAGVIFEFQGTKQFELNEDGNISGATINDNVTSSPSSNALLFDCSSGGTVLWLENDHTIHSTENFEDRTSSFPEVGLLFLNPYYIQILEILCQGRLYIAGRNRQLKYAVAYVDDVALFECNSGSEEYELKYHNILTPGGIEGRIEYPGNEAIYYIKDHLGSIREVINEHVDLLQSTQYHSYGNKDNVLVSSVQARESFTGKEFDEDGTENGAFGIQLYYFGVRFYDPETGIWISNDPAGQLFNPYGYANNPILFVDENGESFTIGAFFSAVVVGAVTSAAASSASYSLQTMYTDQNWTGSDFATSALTGAASGAVSGAAGYSVGTLFSKLTKKLASGLAQYMITTSAAYAAGGFAADFTSGIISSAGDLGEAFGAAGLGALKGGVTGAALGAIQYGMNYQQYVRGASYREYHRHVRSMIRRGWMSKQYQQTIDFVANEFNLGNYSYYEWPKAPNPMAARGATVSSSSSEIYKRAFYRPKLVNAATGEWKKGRFDPTSLIGVMDHEGFHQRNYMNFYKGSLGSYKNLYLRTVHEVGAHATAYMNSVEHGLSRGMIKYYEYKYLEEMRNLKILGGF